MINFTVKAQNESEILYRLDKLKELVRRGLVDSDMGTLTVQGRLLAEHCIRLAPPQNKAQGQKRIESDFNYIFQPIDPLKMDSPSVRKLVIKSDPKAWEAFSQNLKKGPLRNTVAVFPTLAKHAQHRDKRGRALRGRDRMVTLFAQQRELKRLIKFKQGLVGWAKAGFLKGYLALGGTRAPAWVTRHGTDAGVFIDHRGDPVAPGIAVYNDTRWGKTNDEGQRIVNTALRARGRAIKAYYEKMMQLAAEGKQTPFQVEMSQPFNGS